MDKKEIEEKETQNLFKVASQELEEENKINSFKDAIKELEEEKNADVSFESLLQTAEENNDSETELNNDSNMLDLNQILEQGNEETESSDSDIGGQGELLKESNVKLEDIEEELKDKNPFTQTEEMVNPFISDNEEQEEISKEEYITPEEKIEPKQEDNPFTKTEEIENPFVSNNELVEDKEKQELETAEVMSEQNKEVKEENPFIQTEEIENPFVSNNELEEDKEIDKTEVISEQNNKIKEENPFIQTEEKVNPFISNNDIQEELPKEENTTSEEKIKPNQKDNPFFANQTFEEDNKIEINPFFQNNIELNEKQKYQNQNKLDLSNVPHYHVKIQKKKPKKLKFILGVLSYAVFIWLLLIGITLLVYVADIKIREMKGDYTPPKYNAYVVLTGSMLPQIQINDVVVTKKVDVKDLQEGDIITFASSDERFYGTVITHRIKKKYYDSTTGKYTFQSKGDNNNVADSALVEEDRIYGKVILKIPKLGYLQVFLASKGGWILVILIPCAVVISFDIMKLFKMIIQKRKLKIAK